MKYTTYGIVGMALVSLFAGCRTSGTNRLSGPVSQESTISQKSKGGDQQVSSPLVLVYKTKIDYSQLVPVIMNEGRTKIVSYPAPEDVIDGDQLLVPTALDNGYWLDNRGISPNMAFLTYTYAEYSKLPSAPSPRELMKHIADRYPLTELYRCGRRAGYTDLVDQLNRLIRDGFPGCEKVKIIGPVLLHGSK